MIIKANQTLRKAYNDIAVSPLTTTPYASKIKGAEWYNEHEDSARKWETWRPQFIL